MKNKKIITFIITLSLLLAGCNINQNPPVVTSNESSYNSETDTPVVTTPDTDESYAPMLSETNVTTSAAEITTNTEASTAASAKDETEMAVSAPQLSTEAPATQAPVTQAPVVKTEPPAVVTTTTAAAPPAEPSPPTIHSTTADGVHTFTNSKAVIDYSNTDDGYVMTKYTGSNNLVKVIVDNSSGVRQIYTINTSGNFEAIPLTAGNGEYTISVCEAVGSKYAVVNTGKVSVTLSNSLAPFLRPSNYVPFDYGDSAVTKSSQLCGGTANDLEKIDRVYSWLVDNVTYDYDLAGLIIAGGKTGGYVPDTEKVINKKIGICLDYAGTMAAMLRSQNIPVQLISGYAGSTFHAWVNVYVTDAGWVYGAIYFDGSAWNRMDPTYASTSKSSDAILKYIGDGSNYSPKYVY